MITQMCPICLKPYEAPEKMDKCYKCRKKELLEKDFQHGLDAARAQVRAKGGKKK